MKRNNIVATLFIGLCFMWTGSGYLSWLYHLMDIYPSGTVDVLSEVIGYLFQAAGIGLYALAIKKSRKFDSPAYFTIIVILDFVFVCLSCITSKVLLMGYSMNLLHGAIAGFYLTKLVICVNQQKRGIVFGGGYAIGSIGTWLISRIDFTEDTFVLILYAFLAAASIVFTLQLKDEKQEGPQSQAPSSKLILLTLAVVFLFSTVKNEGFYFPSADLNGTFTLEFTRLFYAIGLIGAGIINDLSRKYGGICCACALLFPFMILLLRNDISATMVFWILGYLFFGFFTVYRVILFTDLAGKRKSLIYLAGFGYLAGRIGDSLGALLGMKIPMVVLIVLSSVLFIMSVILFLRLYDEIYVKIYSPEEVLKAFAEKHGFSQREAEVFALITEGRSNAEIAGDLFISENTVKFHIKNLLKKTGCSNRTELMGLFRN